MEYRNLGRTGVKVSPLCLGTMNFGPRTPEADAIKMMDAAIDAGINFVDTANYYGQPLKDGRGQGASEEIIGKALKQNGKRDFIVLATKFTMYTENHPEDPNSFGGSRRHIMQEVEKSLRRLQTDHIDLYQLHSAHLSVPIDETLRALDDLVTSGKVRYIGTSNHPSWRIMEGLWTSDKLRLNRFVSEQASYSILHRTMEREVVPVAERFDIALIPFSPLFGGVLTGKYRRDTPFPDESRFKFKPWDGYWSSGVNDVVYDAVDALDEMAQKKGCTLSQLALAWVINQKAITSPIIGPRTVEQLQDNIGAIDVTFSDEDFARIDDFAPPGSSLVAKI